MKKATCERWWNRSEWSQRTPRSHRSNTCPTACQPPPGNGNSLLQNFRLVVSWWGISMLWATQTVMSLFAEAACPTCCFFSATEAKSELWGFISCSIYSYPFFFSNWACIDILQYTANCNMNGIMVVTPDLCNLNSSVQRKSRNESSVPRALAVPEKSKCRIASLMVKNEYCEEVTGGHFRFHVKETKHKLTFYKGQVKNWIF